MLAGAAAESSVASRHAPRSVSSRHSGAASSPRPRDRPGPRRARQSSRQQALVFPASCCWCCSRGGAIETARCRRRSSRDRRGAGTAARGRDRRREHGCRRRRDRRGRQLVYAAHCRRSRRRSSCYLPRLVTDRGGRDRRRVTIIACALAACTRARPTPDKPALDHLARLVWIARDRDARILDRQNLSPTDPSSPAPSAPWTSPPTSPRCATRARRGAEARVA